nr:type IV pilus modification protein PilV [Amphritea balenae]
MLEVLIALVVFSVSLLGLALMQNSSMQGLSGSGQLSDAVFLAEDMAERIRANRRHALAASTYDSIGNAADKDCSTGCTSAEIAAKDLNDWQIAVQNLSNGAAAIARTGDAFNITVRWNEKNQDTAGDTVAKFYAIRIEP